MSGSARHILSKSTFIRGCQCHKSLWLYKHLYRERDPISPEQRAIFDRGTQVGLLARELYPGGVDASPGSHFQHAKWLRNTAEAIASGAEVIYEAAFSHAGVLAAIDILVKAGDSYRAFEVKSSTAVTETYLLDASLQHFVITGSGLPLSDFSLVWINSDYVRRGRLDLYRLFAGRSVLEEVLARREWVAGKIEELSKVAVADQEPVIPIGPHCHDPYPCDFIGRCWRRVQEYSVFDLPRLDETKKFELYHSGIASIADIPESYHLSARQRLQVEAERSGEPIIKPEAIEELLDSVRYPLQFLDFEAFQPAVPLYDDSSPYQQIPFQFSLHLVRRPDAAARGGAGSSATGGEPEHREFLAEADGDPRPPFLQALLDAVEERGSILVYNRSFEVGRLTELAELFPERAEALSGLIERVVDLMTPFQCLDYYLPAMRCSYSIKQVLPALAPELSYDDLAIGDGTAAALAFQGLIGERDPSRREAVRRHLLDYCRMDTYAMVRIHEELRKAVGRP